MNEDQQFAPHRGPWPEPLSVKPGLSPGARTSLVWAALIMLAIYFAGAAVAGMNSPQSLEACEQIAAASYNADNPHGLKAIPIGDLKPGWSHLADGEAVLVTNGCAFVQPTGVDLGHGVALKY